MGKRNHVWFLHTFPQICTRKMPIIIELALFNTLRNEDPDLLLSIRISGTFAAVLAATALLLVVKIARIVASISASVPDRRS